MADLDQSKRSLLQRLMRLLGGVAVLEASWIAASALMPRRRTSLRANGPGVLRAGPIERFACPGYASAFDIRGDVVNAPAPCPLRLFPLSIGDGVVRVDTSRPIRRAAFDLAQVVPV